MPSQALNIWLNKHTLVYLIFTNHINCNTMESNDAASTSPPAADAQPAQSPNPVKRYKQVTMPTAEEIMQGDIMDNCGVRTVMSTVAGCGLGAVFGLFMGVTDPTVVRQQSATNATCTYHHRLAMGYTHHLRMRPQGRCYAEWPRLPAYGCGACVMRTLLRSHMRTSYLRTSQVIHEGVCSGGWHVYRFRVRH